MKNSGTLKWLGLIGLCIFLMVFSGCRDPNLIESSYHGSDSNLIESSYYATDRLIEQVKPPFFRDQTILIASFVNIDNLEESSTFGRTISEYMGSRLSQHGFKVIELKLRKSIFIKKNAGEFLLSRDLHNISTRYQANAIVVGTYSVGANVVYVSARIIKLSDNTIMASYGYKMPMGKNITKMIGQF